MNKKNSNNKTMPRFNWNTEYKSEATSTVRS